MNKDVEDGEDEDEDVKKNESWKKVSLNEFNSNNNENNYMKQKTDR